MQGMWFLSLVGDLRSRMPQGTKALLLQLWSSCTTSREPESFKATEPWCPGACAVKDHICYHQARIQPNK